MIRYSYTQDVTPPAPFVHVTLHHPLKAETSVELPAQLDSAADRTVIPAQAASTLQLESLRQLEVMGIAGHLITLSTCLILLQIRHLQPFALEVLVSSEEPYVLLGRDVLNRYRIVLDGPRQAVEIE